jgi:hypothetical protein
MNALMKVSNPQSEHKILHMNMARYIFFPPLNFVPSLVAKWSDPKNMVWVSSHIFFLIQFPKDLLILNISSHQSFLLYPGPSMKSSVTHKYFQTKRFPKLLNWSN